MYRLLEFAGLTLPRAAAVAELSTAPSRPRVVGGHGGVYDLDGQNQAQPELPYTLTYRCEILGNNLNTLRQTLDAWRSRRGKVGSLVRQALNDGAEHQATARLLQLRLERQAQQVYVQPVEFQFLILSRWRAMTPTISQYVIGGSQPWQVVIAGTAPVTDAVLTLSPAAPTAWWQVIVYNGDVIGAPACAWRYAPATPFSAPVTVDAGAWTVRCQQQDAYANLHLLGEHRYPTLLYLPVGTSWIVPTTNTASGTVQLTCYECYE
ncbi:MAG: hypothetical protein N2383_03345 [Caldilineales bacterium]|nr:hypothetical protein [Caldilineales bacterium]